MGTPILSFRQTRRNEAQEQDTAGHCLLSCLLAAFEPARFEPAGSQKPVTDRSSARTSRTSRNEPISTAYLSPSVTFAMDAETA